MKKNYLIPETTLFTGYENPILELGSTIDVSPGEEGSQQDAEAKAHIGMEEDDDYFNSYWRDPLDYLPNKFSEGL